MMLGFYNRSVMITYLALMFGFAGTTFLFDQQFDLSLLCLVLAGICDMFDGKVARKLTRTDDEKKYGIEIDSLSDIFCFGAFPALFAFQLGLKGFPGYLVLLLYVVAALTRLGYFNVTEEQRQKTTEERRKEFQGLPVTSIAITFPVVYLFKNLMGNNFIIALGIFMLLNSILFVVKIRVKKLNAKGFLVLAALAIVLFARLFHVI